MEIDKTAFPLRKYGPDPSLIGKAFLLVFKLNKKLIHNHFAILIDVSGHCEYDGGSEVPTKFVGILFQINEELKTRTTKLSWKIIDGLNSLIKLDNLSQIFCLGECFDPGNNPTPGDWCFSNRNDRDEGLIPFAKKVYNEMTHVEREPSMEDPVIILNENSNKKLVSHASVMKSSKINSINQKAMTFWKENHQHGEFWDHYLNSITFSQRFVEALGLKWRVDNNYADEVPNIDPIKTNY